MQLQLIPVYNTISSAIKELYHHSFPLYERRPWPQQEKLFAENKLHLKELLLADKFAGFIFYWQLNGFAFIEHFAIDEPARGKGTGSQVMQYFTTEFTSVVLETERAEKDNAAFRRLLFYEKLGYQKFPFFYRQPPYSPGYPFQEMLLLHNGLVAHEAAFEKTRDEIYEHVYGYTGL